MSNPSKLSAVAGSTANSSSSGLGILSKRNLNAHTKPPPRPAGNDGTNTTATNSDVNQRRQSDILGD